jgi:acyl carrier protein
MGALPTKELIRQFVMRKIAGKNERMSINDKDDIITAGIIDSLGIMQLVAFIEETFSIEIKDEDIVPDNFESIETISSFIEKTR